MKPNVDLTQNRDFMKPRKLSLSRLSILIKRVNNIEFPWSDMNKITSTLKEEEIFFTGNKDVRKNKKYYRLQEDKFCDKCGVEVGRVAWRFEMGLCERCDEEVANSLSGGKYPWSKLEKDNT